MACVALGTICHVIFYNKVAFVDFFFFWYCKHVFNSTQT